MKQSAWVAAAIGCFVAAGLLQETRRTRSNLWEIVPGRAFIVSYLWIRADRLKEEGRYYDAMQQAEWICHLQSRFPSVWGFIAWNMAWNISVATHTPQERWLWVHNGLRLLRDDGIRLNPKSLLLYKELGWIFFFKLGGNLDDMHWTYKRQWAVRMQDLLGAPPEGSTEQVIAAFRPIAEAALDRDPDRQGRQTVQGDKLLELLADPEVKAYAALLAEHGAKVDETFLSVHTHFSRDPAVTMVRTALPEPADDRDFALSKLIGDPAHASARRKILAFLRAQILWNEYRMDPAVMLKIMQQYGPLDWRLPEVHGVYWLVHGRDVCGDASPDRYDALNTDRIALSCLQDLTSRGRLTMIDARPRGTTEDVLSLEPTKATADKDLPRVRLYRNYDLRFVQATHDEYMRRITAWAVSEEKAREQFAKNPLRNGHINYLVNAIKTLYAGHRRVEAQRWLNWIRENYKPVGPEWVLSDVEDFVLWGLHRDRDAPRGLAESQISVSLAVALVAMARGDQTIGDESYRYARKVHRIYNEDRDERTRLTELNNYAWTNALRLLVAPRALGYHLTLTERSALYKGLDEASREAVYPRAAGALKQYCKAEGMDFAKAFPPPPSRRKKPAGRPAAPALISP